jgi:molybdate transport system substrate-binding protein
MKKSLAILGLVSGVWLGRAFAAGEVAVLSAGAVEPGLKAAAAAFEKQTRHVVKITFNTVPQVRKRIDGGERADVVIATPAVLDEFAKAGKIEKERAPIGRIGMGVAVRTGAAAPDIASGDALKRSLLAGDGVVFSRGSSGLYFEGLLKKMGIADQIHGKVTRYDEGASVFEHVLKSKGNEVAVGQMTEIGLFRDKGLRLVGPLPADVQNYTSYAAAPMTGATNAEGAREFVRYLGTPAAKALFAAAGIDQ